MERAIVGKMLFCVFVSACILSCAFPQKLDAPKQEITEIDFQEETSKSSNSANPEHSNARSFNS
jgi:hypothetical protein